MGANNEFYSPGGGNSLIYLSSVAGEDQGNAYEVIFGTFGDDTMTSGGGADDSMWGMDGADQMSVSDGTLGRMRGGDGGDTITGADMNDRMRGDEGDDIINGNGGTDTVRYNNSPDGVFVNLSDELPSQTRVFNGDDTTVNAGTALDGWGTTDTIFNVEDIEASNSNDVLIGSSGGNRIEGFDGDDLIEGLGDDDLLNGGAGVDTYVWRQDEGVDTIVGAGSAPGEDIIEIQGTFYDYHWEIDGNDLLFGVVVDDTYDFSVGGGNLRIQDFFTDGDSIAYMEADLGDNNQFYNQDGGSQPTRIYVNAVTGGDQGDNAETIIGTDDPDSGDFMTGGGGFMDFMTGLGGDDTMIAEGFTHTIFRGGDGDDNIIGADGDDVLRGAQGNDDMDGGEGRDIAAYHRPSGSAPITQGAFVNLSDEAVEKDFHGALNVIVQAGEALDNYDNTDTLTNIEDIWGSNFADILIGSSDHNLIDGMDGNDFIAGGNGDDYLIGGQGNDIFAFSDEGGRIQDFEVGVDLLQLENGLTINSLEEFDDDGDEVNDSTNVHLSNGSVIGLLGVIDIADPADLVAPFILGTPAVDDLVGTDFGDTIQGLDADDTLTGGAGIDTYVWSEGDGFDTIVSTGSGPSEDIVRIEGASYFYDYNWEVDGDDLLVGVTADGTQGSDGRYIWTAGGNLRVENFLAGGDSIAYLEANLGEDTNAFYSPNGGNARIYFNSGTGVDQGSYHEVIVGTIDEDTITGGGGTSDLLWGDDGNDTISVSNGTRGLFRGGDGDDTLNGADQNDNFRGSAGNDEINGGDGTDQARYDLPAGSSPITQGAFVNLSAAAVMMTFNGGSTTVQAGQALDNWDDTDTLTGIENVRGSVFDDILIGSTGTNRIDGLDGDDFIAGGGSVGGALVDRVTGGEGNDVFLASHGVYIEDFLVGTDLVQLDAGRSIAGFIGLTPTAMFRMRARQSSWITATLSTSSTSPGSMRHNCWAR